MKTDLAVTGAPFALFVLVRFSVTGLHARGAGGESAAWPAPIGVVSAGLAAWAFRLRRAAPSSRP